MPLLERVPRILDPIAGVKFSMQEGGMCIVAASVGVILRTKRTLADGAIGELKQLTLRNVQA